MTLKVRIWLFLTTITQLTARLKTFLRDWLLFLGLKEGLVKCATVCFILDFFIFSRPICFALNFFLLLLVGDIPSYTDNFAGTRAIASFDEKGAYLQNDVFFFKLSCDSNSCSWSLMTQKLSVGRYGTVLMHLPVDYNCAGNWENILHVWLDRIITK